MGSTLEFSVEGDDDSSRNQGIDNDRDDDFDSDSESEGSDGDDDGNDDDEGPDFESKIKSPKKKPKKSQKFSEDDGDEDSADDDGGDDSYDGDLDDEDGESDGDNDGSSSRKKDKSKEGGFDREAYYSSQDKLVQLTGTVRPKERSKDGKVVSIDFKTADKVYLIVMDVMGDKLKTQCFQELLVTGNIQKLNDKEWGLKVKTFI